MSQTHAPQPLLDLEAVSVHYPERSAILRRTVSWVRAIERVSLSIRPGETLGLVGESGCGKTTLGRAVLGLRDLAHGRIRYDGQDLSELTPSQSTRMRRELQLIFQDPYASLDPSAQIGRSIRAGLDIHRIGTRAERAERVAQIMRKVGLDPALADRYPHEFSGGMRQRVVIARALILQPRLVVCDEPTSALDVSIQSQILNMLADLQEEFGLTYLFISHDLGVVEHVADRVAVMYLGRIVEVGDVERLFSAPKHPYTQALLASIPVPDPRQRKLNVPLTGDPPSPHDALQGCPFRSRCPVAEARCSRQEPPLTGTDNHSAACWRLDDHKESAA